MVIHFFAKLTAFLQSPGFSLLVGVCLGFGMARLFSRGLFAGRSWPGSARPTVASWNQPPTAADPEAVLPFPQQAAPPLRTALQNLSLRHRIRRSVDGDYFEALQREFEDQQTAV